MIFSRFLAVLLALTLTAGTASGEKPADLRAGLIQMAQTQEEFEALFARPRTPQALPEFTCEQFKRTINPQFSNNEAEQLSAETKPAIKNNIQDTIKKVPVLEAKEITFAFDSADLTDEGKATVRRLGTVLASTSDPYCLAIYGHTDATGTEAYNQKLSDERAAAVRNVLVSEFGIKEQGLAVHGFGEKQLKYKDKPYDPANRRVELQNLFGG